MISRTAFNQLRQLSGVAGRNHRRIDRYLLAAGCVDRDGPALARDFGGAAWLLMAATYAPLVRFYGLPAIWALQLACGSSLLYGGNHRLGLEILEGPGGQWKGRAQDVE